MLGKHVWLVVKWKNIEKIFSFEKKDLKPIISKTVTETNKLELFIFDKTIEKSWPRLYLKSPRKRTVKLKQLVKT